MADKKTTKPKRKRGRPKKVGHEETKVEMKQKALELRREGYSYLRISKEIGVAPNTASRYVKEALDEARELVKDQARELIGVVMERNDYLITSLWPAASSGDPVSIDRVVKLQQQSLEIAGVRRGIDLTTDGERVSAGHVVAEMSTEALIKLVTG